ncbi:MAG: VanZ family protein [Bacteroidales bacterium]|jgi:VanZ family protein|nr:VanZ family protein [Bacteroidales bacterium]
MTIRKQWPAITWALFILIVTGIPGDQIPKIPTFLDWLSPDKIVHVVIFGILSYLLLYGNRSQYLKSKHRSYLVFTVVLISATYGLITELLQYFVFVGRSGNAFDFYANILGALVGGVAYFLQHAKNKV